MKKEQHWKRRRKSRKQGEAKVTNATVAKAALVLAFFPSSFLLPSVVWRRNRPSHEKPTEGRNKKAKSRKRAHSVLLYFPFERDGIDTTFLRCLLSFLETILATRTTVPKRRRDEE